MKLKSFILFFLTIKSVLHAQIPANPLLHLKADQGITKDVNGLVSQWNDPVRAISASQNNKALQPVLISSGIAGLPALRFNGNNSYMNCPSIFPVRKDYSIVIVCHAFNATNNIVGGNSHTIWMAGSTTPTMLHNGDFSNQVRSSIDPGQEPSLIIAQYREATQRGSFWINGVFADSAYCPSNLDSIIYIAAYQGGYVFNGDIAEVILYNRFLSAVEIKNIESSLLSKYKINRPVLPDGSLIEVPKNNQLYPRDVNNTCNIPIKGVVKVAGFDSVLVQIYQENNLMNSQTSKLNYVNNEASYQFQESITAGLVNYRLELWIKKSNKDSLIHVARKICCGDVLIINGQSNSIFGGSPEQNDFCRTFGKNYSNKLSDTLWTVAQAVGNGGNNDVGAWGMHLAIKLIEQYKVPICMMNGGVGGTAIQSHQRDDINPFAPNSIYGSLNYRMLKSKLANAAKAIFWYQGESNMTPQYSDFFRALYEDWKIDYPNVKKYYVVQIHHGCGTGDNSGVREVLRKLRYTYPDIEVMSTNNLPDHDGCHYVYTGYNLLAEWLLPLVQRDFYGAAQQDDIDAPNLLQAYYTNDLKNEIALLFGPNVQNLSIGNDTTVRGVRARMVEYFALDGVFTNLKSIRARKDTVFLSLPNSSSAKLLTYLPEIYYHNSQVVYQGPYIINKRGIGALSFFNVPIQNKISTSVDAEPKEKNITGQLVRKSDYCQIQITSDKLYHNLKLEIYEIKGSIIYSKFIPEINAGENQIQIDVHIPEYLSVFWRIQNDKIDLSGK